MAQVQEIVRLAPRDRQTMLFSATMTEDVEKLVKVSLRQPVRLAADAAGAAPDALSQEIVRLKVPRQRACMQAGLSHGDHLVCQHRYLRWVVPHFEALGQPCLHGPIKKGWLHSSCAVSSSASCQHLQRMQPPLFSHQGRSHPSAVVVLGGLAPHPRQQCCLMCFAGRGGDGEQGGDAAGPLQQGLRRRPHDCVLPHQGTHPSLNHHHTLIIMQVVAASPQRQPLTTAA